MEDLDAVTKRFMSAEKTHAREMGEQQRCNSDLQGCIAEMRTQVKEVSYGKVFRLFLRLS